MKTLDYLQAKYQKQLVSEQEVARELGVTKREVKALIAEGVIAAIGIGGKYMITISALARFLEGREEKITVNGQHFAGLQTAEELTSSQESLLDIEVEGGDGILYRGSVTHTGSRFISQITIGVSEDGKRKRESKSFKTQEEAEAHLKSRLNELNNEMVVNKTEVIVDKPKGSIMTVKEFTSFYLNLGLSSGTSRTQYGYKEDMKPIIDKIGNNLITEITEDDIKKLFNEFTEKYTQIVINKKWITCKRIFDYAFRKKYINSNIFEDLKRPKSKRFEAEKDRYKAFTDEEIGRIMGAAKEHKTLYPILSIFLNSGLRPSELRALLWQHYSEKEKTIKVVSAITRDYKDIKDVSKSADYKEVVSRPKSSYSTRVMNLPDETVDALREWRKYLDSSDNNAMKESKYIFPSKTGEFMSEEALSSLVKRFVKSNKLEDIGVNLYRFRHNFCTRLILNGVAIPIIQRLLGDNTIRVITDIYTNINNEAVREASQRFFSEQNRKYKETKEEQAS